MNALKAKLSSEEILAHQLSLYVQLVNTTMELTNALRCHQTALFVTTLDTARVAKHLSPQIRRNLACAVATRRWPSWAEFALSLPLVH